MSATTPPSAAAAERAASRPAMSFGTTPSIIAWSWDSRTVAGVARSWAMSLAARRRSISERSSRSAIALNASASSVDSWSSPPVARALASPASSRRAAAATSRNGRVSRPAIDVETKHDPEHADESRDRERGIEHRQEAAVAGPCRDIRLERGDGLAVELDRGRIGRDVARRGLAVRRQRRAVGRDDPDLATERVGEAHHQRLGTDQPGRARQAIGEGHRRVVEPLLLLVGQDGLVARADDAIDHDTDEQQDRHDRDPEQQPEPPGQRSMGLRRADASLGGGAAIGGGSGHEPSRDATRR